MSDGRICFAVKGDWLVLKFIGQIRFTMGGSERPTAALDAFLDERSRHGPNKVIVDLSETETIDSTNLGILARVAVNARECGAERPVVIAPEGDLRCLLESMGFDRIFSIVDLPALPSTDLEQIPHAACDKATGDRELILEAHRTLAGLSPENYETFKDVIRLMEGERANENGA